MKSTIMESEERDSDLYCICQKPYLEGQFMIECGKCNEWFHGSCVGIEEYHAQDIDIYHCPNCQPVYGPLVLKKRRNVSKHNYKEIHEGTKQISAGTIMFIRQLKVRKFLNAEDVTIQFENGGRLTADYFQENAFEYPILVYEKTGLNLVVPPSNFTVYDVEKRIGSMFELHVIDVARQEDLRMKMREWTEYFNSPVRGKVLNVISLEFSKTSMSDLVMAPEIVRNISWVENVWPKEPPEDSPHTVPVVAKYCLMSVKDCYTDFHVDFGGTSVWYHIVRGEKIFYLIEPTAVNLKKYGQWVSSSDQSQVFFGEKVEKCYKLNVRQGNTLFIPTGWIHAVYTPKDTLVFGGNFLHTFNIGCQNQIYALEKALKTPLKFLFPNYETTNWYAARHILKKIKGIHAAGYRIPKFLVDGVEEMIKALKMWTSKKDELTKYHKLQVPIEINPQTLIKNLEKELKEDAKLGEGSDFPTGELPSPAIVSTASSKTVLRLKLSTSKEPMSGDGDGDSSQNEIVPSRVQKKKEKLKKKEKRTTKVEQIVGDSDSEPTSPSCGEEAGGIKEKRKRGRPRKENGDKSSKMGTNMLNTVVKGGDCNATLLNSPITRISSSEEQEGGGGVEGRSLEALYPSTTRCEGTDDTKLKLKLSLPSSTLCSTATAGSPIYAPESPVYSRKITTPSSSTSSQSPVYDRKSGGGCSSSQSSCSPVYAKKSYTSTLSSSGMKLNATAKVETKLGDTPRHCLDMKAEFEAAKRDIFKDEDTEEEGDEKPATEIDKLFFKPREKVESEDDCTVKPVTFNPHKNFPSKSKPKAQVSPVDPDYYDPHSLIIDTSKSQAKKNKPSSATTVVSPLDSGTRDSGSDYDPTDDAYYEDAEFVYPRIDVTSEISDEDFSWRPGQRKKPKTGDKRKGSHLQRSSSKYDDSYDPFFAPDDTPFEKNFTYRHDCGDTSPEIPRQPTQSRSTFNQTPSSLPASSSSSSSLRGSEKERPPKKEVKKGFATAKQRLGKLLKLDKTGTRYVR